MLDVLNKIMMRLCSGKKTLLLETNYILLDIVAIVRFNVYGDFKLLCPLLLE